MLRKIPERGFSLKGIFMFSSAVDERAANANYKSEDSIDHSESRSCRWPFTSLPSV